MTVDQLLARLTQEGLLLQADATLPSLTQLVTGESIKGSWWGHPRGTEIFNLSNDLADHADVMVIKLVAGKVTFVHRPLWPAVVGVGQAQEAWQTKGLSAVARALLERTQKEGELRPDELVEGRSAKAASFGPFITELEKRLLVQAEQIHTESGAHARVVYSWANWVKARGLGEKPLAPAAGRAKIEAVVSRWNASLGTKAKLPWSGLV
jgi:hypothetical protein